MGVGSNLRKYFYTEKGRNRAQFLPLVGVAGFEPAVSWTRTTRNASLRDAGGNAVSICDYILGYLTVLGAVLQPHFFYSTVERVGLQA